jgi:hypothetical protein
MIKYNLGPIIIYPKNKTIETFFNKIGKVIYTSNENQKKKLWLMTSFLRLCVTDGMAKKI